MEACLTAIDRKMALVVPMDEAERASFFPYLTWPNISFIVLVWTHSPHKIPGLSTVAHCPVNIPDITTLQDKLRTKEPNLHNRTIVTLSLQALKFVLRRPNAPDRLNSALLDKTTVIPYTEVCRKIDLNGGWTWSMDKRSGCVQVYKGSVWISSMHDASDGFIVFSTGVALFDMHMDDYRGVCGRKHVLTNAVVRGVNISSRTHA
ncbi:unnamed protein product [Ixodes pacificus]